MSTKSHVVKSPVPEGLYSNTVELYGLHKEEKSVRENFERILKDLNKLHENPVTILKPQGVNLPNLYSITSLIKQDDGRIALYFAYTIAKKYDGHILNAWADGYQNVLLNVQKMSKLTLDMVAASTYIDKLFKSLVNNYYQQSINFGTLEAFKNKLADCERQINRSKRNVSSTWYARLTKRGTLNLCNQYLNDLTEVQIMLKEDTARITTYWKEFDVFAAAKKISDFEFVQISHSLTKHFIDSQMLKDKIGYAFLFVWGQEYFRSPK